MPTVHVQGPSNTVFVLEEGALDDRALLAFTGGQCHGLALALQRRTGWQLVAVYEATGACSHICVRRPDGRLIDITGAHSTEEITAARGGTVRDIDGAVIDELEAHHGWAPAETRRAAAWVDVVLHRATREAPRKPMSSNEFARVFTSDGVELRIVWGGSEYMEVYVRRTAVSEQDWTDYGRANLSPDPQTGAFVIDFTAERFEELTKEWLREQFDRDLADRRLAEAI